MPKKKRKRRKKAGWKDVWFYESTAEDDTDESQALFDLSLDKLEEYWLEHPKLSFQYAEQLAEAKKDLAEAKAEMKTVEADLAARMREDPEEFEIASLSEAAINRTMPSIDEWQEANQKIIDNEYRVDLLWGYVNSLRDRKEALENLVTLHGQQYFAKPTDKTGEMEESSKRSARSARTKRRKKK